MSGSTTLESGATVRYSETATAIGDDANTLQNFFRSKGAAGHDLIVHGMELEEGTTVFVVNGEITNTQQIAAALVENPHYTGGPLQLVTCYGCGLAAEFEETLLGLGVKNPKVIAKPTPVELNPHTGLLQEVDPLLSGRFMGIGGSSTARKASADGH